MRNRQSAFQCGKGLGESAFSKKLYISAHSAVESQEFYRSMGCIEATEYNQSHVEKSRLTASWNACFKYFL